MSRRSRVKRLCDDKAMLNLGCGTTMHMDWTNLDFSAYAWLARHPGVAALMKIVGILSAERAERLRSVDPSIIHWDLRKGLPFDDCTFDVVYLSHVLEHFPRESALPLMCECRRVIRPGGIVRVVVPDLAALWERYRRTLRGLDSGDVSALVAHEEVLHDLFEQMVGPRYSLRDRSTTTVGQEPGAPHSG
jgi:SAM-dependent methyltransferase